MGETGKMGEGCGITYENCLSGMRESIEVDEIFDLTRETKQGGGHDVLEVVGQGLHIIAWFLFEGRGHPEIVNISQIVCKMWTIGTYQSYSAVSTKSSILELTTSKILFSAVFLLLANSSVALSTIGPPADEEDRAAIRSCSNSRQAVSKCSRFIKIWTI